MVTLARLGLTTGFLLGPADDKRVSPSLLPRSRFSSWVTCAVNIQGELGEGTLAYKVMIIYRVCLEKAQWFPGLESCWTW